MSFLQNMPMVGIGGESLPGLANVPGMPGNGLIPGLPGGGMPLPGGPDDPIAQLLQQIGISPGQLPLLKLAKGETSPLGALVPPGLGNLLG